MKMKKGIYLLIMILPIIVFCACNTRETNIIESGKEILETNIYIDYSETENDVGKDVEEPMDYVDDIETLLSYPSLSESMFSYEIIDDHVVINSYAYANMVAGYEDFWMGKVMVIPDTIEGYPVTEIGMGAFTMGEFYAVILGENIETIGINAFKMSQIRTVIVKGNALKDIKASAFESCEKLTTVILPKDVENIEEDAFRWCNKLEEITY